MDTYNVKVEERLVKVGVSFGVAYGLGLDQVPTNLKLNTRGSHTGQLELPHIAYAPWHHLKQQSVKSAPCFLVASIVDTLSGQHCPFQFDSIVDTLSGQHHAFQFDSIGDWILSLVLVTTSIAVLCSTGRMPLGTWYTLPLFGGRKGSSFPFICRYRTCLQLDQQNHHQHHVAMAQSCCHSAFMLPWYCQILSGSTSLLLRSLCFHGNLTAYHYFVEYKMHRYCDQCTCDTCCQLLTTDVCTMHFHRIHFLARLTSYSSYCHPALGRVSIALPLP